MILLLCFSDFDIRDDVDSRRKVNLRVFVYAANCRHLLTVLKSKLLEVTRDRLETVTYVVFICISTY